MASISEARMDLYWSTWEILTGAGIDALIEETTTVQVLVYARFQTKAAYVIGSQLLLNAGLMIAKDGEYLLNVRFQ